METLNFDHELKGRDFISLLDWSTDELSYILAVAAKLKETGDAGAASGLLKGKVLGMVFAKPSMRTRVSFEIGMLQLGGHALNLPQHEIGMGERESVADIARVLSRYVDAIMIRTFSHEQVIELARHADIPVINGLTDREHPCQVLADLLTIQERFGTLAGRKLVYAGDSSNNVACSLLHGCAHFGMEIVLAGPANFAPKTDVLQAVQALAGEKQGKVLVTDQLHAALAGADIVYTDVWTSMGQEEEQALRRRTFAEWTITPELMALAHPDAIFMHCLPAHRGDEVLDAVIDGPQSVVFDQAENRLHAQKALLALTMG